MITVPGISLPFTEPFETACEIARKKLDAPDGCPALLVKRAVDARHKNDIRFVYSIGLELDNKTAEPEPAIAVPAVKPGSPRPVVAGFGPAGMFAALYLARAGASPVVIERGQPLERRVRDVEGFMSGGRLCTESNIQFGEGGAGAFSDGKLTTRINDPFCGLVLRELCRHGAPKSILAEAKPHVGTDLLRGVVKSIREEIIGLGGEIRFNTRLTGLKTKSGRLAAIATSSGEIEAEKLILAPGHSARDTFRMLAELGVGLEPKPFSVGVRAEHLQSDVDRAMYGRFAGHPLLPPAEYRHSLRRGDVAVYTFCMCPGGLVVPAASEEGGVVTNGMSEHARARVNANAALVVSVSAADYGGALFGGVEFQRLLERAAYIQGGQSYAAPVQDMGSFLDGKPGFSPGKVLPGYSRGVAPGDFAALFPPAIVRWLKEGAIAFGKKQSGFDARDAVLTGVETRTSSPIRIPRRENRQCEAISGLYPCGEGAGYAGGIMSAAVDGWRTAAAAVSS